MRRVWLLGGIVLAVFFVVMIVQNIELRPYQQRAADRVIVAAAGRSGEDLRDLLEKGGNVNSRAQFGWTPLISAIYHHQGQNVQVLLSKGANVNLADENGQTPLMWAVEVWGENTNLIVMLLGNGADPFRQDRFGSDAFALAQHRPNADELETLLKTVKVNHSP